jgi:hypothetical protein
MTGLEQTVSVSWGCSLYSWLCGEARRSSLRTTQVQNMQAENIFSVELRLKTKKRRYHAAADIYRRSHLKESSIHINVATLSD